MMGKMNIDKMSGVDPVRHELLTDVRKAGKEARHSLQNNKAAGNDTVSFSDRASEVGRLVENLNELPDVREEKVQGLSEQIAAGNYRPSSDEIADAILKDEKI